MFRLNPPERTAEVRAQVGNPPHALTASRISASGASTNGRITRRFPSCVATFGPIVDNPCPRQRLIRKEAAMSSKCCPSASLPQPSSAASPESFPRRSREQSTQGAPVNRFSSRICAIGRETV